MEDFGAIFLIIIAIIISIMFIYLSWNIGWGLFDLIIECKEYIQLLIHQLKS